MERRLVDLINNQGQNTTSSNKNAKKKRDVIGNSLVQITTLNLGISLLIGTEEEGKKIVEDEEDILRKVEKSCFGNELTFQGPFGVRKAVYCDFTASGKSISFIEDFIREEVLNYYGNVHTTTSISSARTSALRTEAKKIIRECLNCTDNDAVIFASSGLTGAINKLIRCLKFHKEPIVFISPYEHHSNILPWLEIGAEVVYGKEDENGKVDLQYLKQMLVKYATKGRQMIGSFSSASNVTGILTDTNAIATLLHTHGALALFDYATAGPYVDIDMNPKDANGEHDPWAYKDAIFCSIHKFVGGPQTPGLLVAKKHLFQNKVPSSPGGGTVLYVDHNNVKYVDNVEEREEGGTPAIVESIRAGLVFQLKREISCTRIMQEEHRLTTHILARLGKIPNLYVLGSHTAERLPIISFVVEHQRSKRLLHHNFVSALLNDLFGLQVRGGCSCAGPYTLDLLGIISDDDTTIQEVISGNFKTFSDELTPAEIQALTGKTLEILKPGFTRLNLPFFYSQHIIDYIIDCVIYVTKHAWKFLPCYEMNAWANDFKHRKSSQAQAFADLRGLTNLTFNRENKHTDTEAPDFQTVQRQADEIVKALTRKLQSNKVSATSDSFLPSSIDNKLRWFMTPREAHQYIRDSSFTQQDYVPLFTPRTDHFEHADRVQTSRFYASKSTRQRESIKLRDFDKTSMTFQQSESRLNKKRNLQQVEEIGESKPSMDSIIPKPQKNEVSSKDAETKSDKQMADSRKAMDNKSACDHKILDVYY